MFKLGRRTTNGGPSAVELIEASKKLYVKTEALKDTRIDISGPRLFHKTDSEEELAMLYQNFSYDRVPIPIPSGMSRKNITRVSPPRWPKNQPGNYPTQPPSDGIITSKQQGSQRTTSNSNGVAFCLTTLSPPLQLDNCSKSVGNKPGVWGKTDDGFNPLKNGLSSAFQPVTRLRTPPKVTGRRCQNLSSTSMRECQLRASPPPVPPKSEQLRSKMNQRRMFPRTSPLHPPPLHPKRRKTFSDFDCSPNNNVWPPMPRPEQQIHTSIELRSPNVNETANVTVRAKQKESDDRPIPPPRQSLRQRPIPPPRFLRRRQTTSDLDGMMPPSNELMSQSLYEPQGIYAKLIEPSERDDISSHHQKVKQNHSYSQSTSDLNTAIQDLRKVVAAEVGENHDSLSFNQQLEAAIAQRLAEDAVLLEGNDLMTQSCYGHLPSANSTTFGLEPMRNHAKALEVKSISHPSGVTTFLVHPGPKPHQNLAGASNNPSPTAYYSSRDSGHASDNTTPSGMSSGMSNTSSQLSTAGSHQPTSLRRLKSRQASPTSGLPPIPGRLDSAVDFEERVLRWEKRLNETKLKPFSLQDPNIAESANIQSNGHQYAAPNSSSTLTVTVFKGTSGPMSNGSASISFPTPLRPLKSAPNTKSNEQGQQTTRNKDLQAIVSSSISSTDSKGLNEETLHLLVELDLCQLNPKPEESEEASALFFASPNSPPNEKGEEEPVDCSSSLIASSSIFTSISAIPSPQHNLNRDANSVEEPNSSDHKQQRHKNDEAEKKPAVVTKPISQIEKTARVIQWIHGCSTASTDSTFGSTTTAC